MKSLKKQKGFGVGAILLVVSLIGVVAMAISSATKGTTNNSSASQQNQTNASTIRYQGAQLAIAFERMVANGTPVGTITFDNTASTGLFNSTTGASDSQVPPGAAFVTAPTITNIQDPWTYVTSGVTLTGSNSTRAVTLAGLTQGVCQQINLMVTGATTIPTTLSGGKGGEVCYQNGTGATASFTYVRGVL